MKVRVVGDAKSDLQQIKAFISEDKPVAATGVIERIRKTITLLAVLPRLGHRGLVAGTFERRAACAVPRRGGNERELVVLRVYHGAQPRSRSD